MADSRNNPVYFGSNAARAGSTLGQGLEAIANHKMQQLQKQQFQNQFKNIGVNQQGAELLSAFQNQPELLKPLLENIGMFMNQPQTGAQGSPMEQQSWQPNAFTGGGQQTPGLEQYQNGLPGGLELGQAISQLGRQAGNAPIGEPGQQPNLGNAFKSAATKRAERDIEIKEDKLQHQKIQASKKENKTLIDEINKSRRENAKLKPVIAEMRQLSGKVDSPYYVRGLKALGLDDFPAMLNPESQQFQKLQTQLFPGFRVLFGPRGTQREFMEFVKGIPTLLNSKEGRDKVFADFDRMIDAGDAEANSADEIIKEYSGKPLPDNFSGELARRTAAKTEQLRSQLQTFGGAGALPQDFTPSRANAAQYKGKAIIDDVTGKKIRSNGVDWIEEQ